MNKLLSKIKTLKMKIPKIIVLFSSAMFVILVAFSVKDCMNRDKKQALVDFENGLDTLITLNYDCGYVEVIVHNNAIWIQPFENESTNNCVLSHNNLTIKEFPRLFENGIAGQSFLSIIKSEVDCKYCIEIANNEPNKGHFRKNNYIIYDLKKGEEIRDWDITDQDYDRDIEINGWPDELTDCEIIYEEPVEIVWEGEIIAQMISGAQYGIKKIPEDKDIPYFYAGISGDIDEAIINKRKDVGLTGNVRVEGKLIGITATYRNSIFDGLCVPQVIIEKIEQI
ncbi:hypothetical protein KKB40_05640 [Patescibacteria group bacterium]|nr:hypothetical protein [Patescibacteria group bacterium]